MLLACGALAKELDALKRLNGWDHLTVRCLPAELHHTPDEIPPAVDEELSRCRNDYEHMFVAYADCGTGGRLDKVLEKHGVERLPGVHCYEFFAGTEAFATLSDEEPGTFYLTDFLVRHFDRFVVDALGLERHPDLRSAYFGNYRRCVYLAQAPTPELIEKAQECAAYLGLEYIERNTGYGEMEHVLKQRVATWRN
jgi:hypothetical protein